MISSTIIGSFLFNTIPAGAAAIKAADKVSSSARESLYLDTNEAPLGNGKVIKHPALKNALDRVVDYASPVKSFGFRAAMYEWDSSANSPRIINLNISTEVAPVRKLDQPGGVISILVNKTVGRGTTVLDSHNFIVNAKGSIESIWQPSLNVGLLDDSLQKKYFEEAGFISTHFNDILRRNYGYLKVTNFGQTLAGTENTTFYQVDIPAGFDTEYLRGQDDELLVALKSMISYGKWFAPIKELQATNITVGMFIDDHGNMIKEIIKLDRYDPLRIPASNPFGLDIEINYGYGSNTP